MNSAVKAFACVVIGSAVMQLGLGTAVAANGLQTEIRRTAHGVPHITASDYAGLGYGIGYASAEDNLCEMMERMLTIRGERAKYFGAGEKGVNVVSDAYHRLVGYTGRVEALLAGPADSPSTPSKDARALLGGFVAGVNRYLRDTGVDKLPDARCRGANWVQPVSELDYWRNLYAGQVPFQMAGIVGAQPPAPLTAARNLTQTVALTRDDPLPDPEMLGSNAYGLGKQATKSGRGALLANPHYPWDGINRFYRMHLLIPGKLNVVGAGLMNTPLVGIGHTAYIAWTHTVSTARRFGYFELTLDPTDSTRYLVDGKSIAMLRIPTKIMVKAENGMKDSAGKEIERVMYATQYGPVLATENFPWTTAKAYALAVPPQGLRVVDQYLAIWQARSVDDLRTVLGRYQATQFNTTATDAHGRAFFGDMGMIPKVTTAHAERCASSPLARQQWTNLRIPVLDGSRSDCAWQSDADASAPGIFGPAAAPQIFRDDYVTQSNDSHWLTNPSQPLEGYSPVYGDERTPRTLRTLLGLDIVDRRLQGRDGLDGRGFDVESLKASLFNNRHLGAEIARDDVVQSCIEVTPGPLCDALKRWDLRVDLDSRAAHVFHLFVEAGGLQFEPGFDPAKPLEWPKRLDRGNPAVRDALGKTVAKLAELQIPADARLGDVQVETRGSERIPIHGGPGGDGIFNNMQPEDLQPGLGWTSIRHGASFVMAVEFTDRGPRSEGLLTYSQSTNPASPHYSDQTRMYARKEWDDLLFMPEAVKRATLSRVVLSE
ncbi:MAG: acylase [Gammaproteobacteria bacterium]|nr:acylase [Gammaproteobacteria bacterium]